MKIGIRTLAVSAALLLSAGAGFAQYTWQGADIGGNDVQPKGSYVDNGDGTMSITGGGWDIWGGWDGYYYYYTSVTGLVWDASVRVRSLTQADTWTKCELMVHWPTPSGDFWRMAHDPFMGAMTTPSGGANTVEGQYRPRRETDCGGMGGGVAPTYPNQWLRMSRRGPVFTMYTGTDGLNWTQRAQWDTTSTDRNFTGIYWPEPVFVGIAVTSHNNNNPATATISDLTITQLPPTTPPTVVGITVNPTNRTVYAGQEVTFYCDSTNNCVPQLLPYFTSYQWYKNNNPIPNATGKTLTFLTTAADAGAVYHCKASLYGAEGTSTGATLTINPGTLYIGALRGETFWGATSRTAIENGNSGPGALSAWTSLDQPNDTGNDYVRRVSGYFFPPASGLYEFFINSDDDSDLFLTTNGMSPNDKVLIAQETGWSAARKWLSSGNLTQKRSSQFSPDGGFSFPYGNGIELVQGQAYYIEAVHREGGGGDNLSVWAGLQGSGPNDDDPSTLTGTNIAVLTGPVTTLTWVTEPPTTIAAPKGQTVQFNCQAQSDCEFPLNYVWYREGTPAPVATGNSYSLTLVNADDGARFYAVASTPIGGLVITSRVSTVSVQASVFEPGYVKVEVWEGLENRAAVASGTAGLPTYTTTAPKFLLDIKVGDYYTRKVSGYFVPPSDENYVFYVCSDDDTGLYLSTNDLPAGKRIIAEQTDWADPRKWLSGGNTSQKRSDSYTPDGGTTYPGTGGYPLKGGSNYYIEAVHHQGSGGDNLGATYHSISEAGPQDGDDTRLVGNRIGMNAPRSRAWFVQQPVNVTAAPYTYARFTVVGGTDSSLPVGSATDIVRTRYLMYQWQRDGIDIPGATASTLTTMVTPSDSGHTYGCRMRSLGLADNNLTPVWTNSVQATLTVQGVFEPGYSLVEFWPNNYNKDGVLNNTAGLPQYITTSPAFEANADGGGNPPDGINDYARRMSGYFIPAQSGVYDFFVTSDDDSNVYLTTNGLSPLDKILICQETQWSGGNRQWRTAGDANNARALPQRRSDQWSPDGGSTVPYAEGFNLVVGQKYYLEVVQHEGGGGDYVQVTALLRTAAPVEPPVNGTASVLLGNLIGTYVPKSTVLAFTTQPTNLTVNGAVTAYFQAQAVSDSTVSIGVIGKPDITQFVKYQWYKNDAPIPGETKPTLAYPVTTGADDGAVFVCKARGLGFSDASLNPIWSNSAPATLTINDPTPPSIVYASMFTDVNVQPNVTIIDILFSKRMDPITLNSVANYSIPGMSVQSIQIRTNDYKAVRLTVTGTPGTPWAVTLTGMKDYVGNSLPAGATMAISSVTLISKDIGFDRGFKTNDIGTVFTLHDPQFPTLFWVDGAKAFTISAQGSDIWNTNDGFNFSYEVKDGNFDIAVRQTYITKSSTWAKGGLMARESLDPTSRHWAVLNTPASADGVQAADNGGTGANIVAVNSRVATGGASGDGWWVVNPGTNPPPAYPNAWVRLQRVGNVMKAYSSTNGVDWLLRGTQDATQAGSSNALPAQMFVGIATTGHNNDEPDATWQRFWNTSGYANYGPVTVAPVMAASLLGNNLSISWAPAGGFLESSPVLGPGAVWTPVTGGTANPALVPLTAEPRFFRVSVP